jgi:hypothetical protein
MWTIRHRDARRGDPLHAALTTIGLASGSGTVHVRRPGPAHASDSSHRRMPTLRQLPLLFALGAVACLPLSNGATSQLNCLTTSADTSGWHRIVDGNGFSFLLPPGFRENKVEEIRSHVRGFEADGLSLSIDYGNTADDLRSTADSTDLHLECPTTIGGRDALVVLTWPDRMAYGAAAAWRDVGAGTHLWIGGAANTPNGQRALLTVLRSVRFNQP